MRTAIALLWPVLRTSGDSEREPGRGQPAYAANTSRDHLKVPAPRSWAALAGFAIAELLQELAATPFACARNEQGR
jgi:hypothetical protein